MPAVFPAMPEEGVAVLCADVVEFEVAVHPINRSAPNK
ncbi:hypothetical protein C900_02053 [Fulvivirga imtechensis AK7]|uniref:Uncharacterized protein n=1 Tax=Fulvivirga imtechensis AK7 TaxID=1237149 RepID=L8K152_9BACT|nr:hypothetical protein C900_02053 [Fulvivirga imtechensis AK7]